MTEPTTEAGRDFVQSLRDFEGAYVWGHDYEVGEDAVVSAVCRIEREAAARAAGIGRFVREMAVEHEADPPGIDYVTVQIPMEVWDEMRLAAEKERPTRPVAGTPGRGDAEAAR